MIRLVPGESYDLSMQVTTIVSSLLPPAFAISPSGSRIFTVQRNVALVEAWAMIDLSVGSYVDTEPVLARNGFGAEYFACGTQVNYDHCASIIIVYI